MRENGKKTKKKKRQTASPSGAAVAADPTIDGTIAPPATPTTGDRFQM